MITSIREFVDLLCKLKISPNQFLICMLIHERDMAATIKYYEENQVNRFSHKDIDELLERGLLLRITKDEKHYNLDQFIVTDLFSREFLIDNDDAGEEFWNAYPSWIHMNNKKVSAKSCDKDDLIEKYAKKIKGSVKRHRDIMAVLEKYAEENNGQATMGIDKFVGSEQWTILKQAYEENTGDLITNL